MILGRGRETVTAIGRCLENFSEGSPDRETSRETVILWAKSREGSRCWENFRVFFGVERLVWDFDLKGGHRIYCFHILDCPNAYNSVSLDKQIILKRSMHGSFYLYLLLLLHKYCAIIKTWNMNHSFTYVKHVFDESLYLLQIFMVLNINLIKIVKICGILISSTFYFPHANRFEPK